ncbi:MAG: excinuclease ABC subunit UvrA [Waddliaceae bacterium]
MKEKDKDKAIVLKKVQVHNLQSVDLELKINELIVFTGVSGSGKSSMAFDTIYREGQRRFVESLSTFARRQMGDMAKPLLESATGISPTISIEQKTAGRNPRSTVGTITEIYDYMRVLYARIGIPHCPVSHEPVLPQSKEAIIRKVQMMPENCRVIILSPFAKGKKGEFKEEFQGLLRKGFTRIRLDKQFVDLEEEIHLDRTKPHDIDLVIDRLVVNNETHLRIAESVTTALELSNGVCSIYDPAKEEETLFSMHAYSPKSGLSYGPLEPHDFSFNSPHGMCSKCNGLGTVIEYDLEKIIDPDKSISEDCCSVASSYQTVKFGNIYDNLAMLYDFSVDTPWKKLPEKAKHVFLYGTEKKWTRMQFVNPRTGSSWSDHIRWQGVLHEAKKRYEEAKSEKYRQKMQALMTIQSCPDCNGERLKAYPAATKLGGVRISKLADKTIQDIFTFFTQLKLTESERLIGDELLNEIQKRLQFLLEVGLHYLTLNRTAPTLSGGEAQRVRLAAQIGSGLVGITYVLDEPSIGLHPRDNKKLISTLKHLKDVGNTVIVVEHDEETVKAADSIVDFGPGPGSRGGKVLVNGSLDRLLSHPESLTGQYLTGKRKIEIPKKRRKPKKSGIKIHSASHHNLKNIDVNIPLGAFIAVTGVSGSGKSSLISGILHPSLSNTLHHGQMAVGAHKKVTGANKIDKIIAIDQSPIGRNPRSNPSTYIKAFDEVRELFSSLPLSRARGYEPGRFSFNVRHGSCSECSGMGMIKIDMDFLEDDWTVCPQCLGKRFDDDTLEIQYKGHNIYDILEMEVERAYELFSAIPSIAVKLSTLMKVGMGYIKLGQSSTTLSGGEAQRIKLAKELARPSTGQTLYILDEPTTGLHFHDIKHLLEVLQELVKRGNTVLVIEHNMDVVKTADWIIDLGPEGGAGGGELVAEGTPEKISQMQTPTGVAVKEALFAKPLTAKEIPTQKRTEKQITEISVKGASQNNLKHLDLTIPREKMTVCTGPSGSGKSSLAFDTLYAEGQRRYIESLSPYARQFVKQMPKPKVEQIHGLSPAVAIEQKAHAGNPRSTVGTQTEIYDYLRILYSREGVAHAPDTGEVIESITKETVINRILKYPERTKIQVAAPIEIRHGQTFKEKISRLRQLGYVRLRLNGETFDIDQEELLNGFDPKRQNELLLIVDRLIVSKENAHRIFEAVETALKIGKDQLVVIEEAKDRWFNLAFAAPSTGKAYPPLTPHTFSFNHKAGMCLDCQGLGYVYGANLLQFPELLATRVKDLFHFFSAHPFPREIFEQLGIDPQKKIETLSGQQLNLLMNGSSALYSMKSGLQFHWIGLNNLLSKVAKAARQKYRNWVLPYLHETDCVSCKGSRLNPLARHVTLSDLTLPDLCHFPIEKAALWIQNLRKEVKSSHVLEEVWEQLIHRLKFLCDVGLGYLSLDRKAPTLSGGEAQRIRLARQMGSGLTGLIYVLDEPSIGLHPADNELLNRALINLKELGNTLVVVEHEPSTIQIADLILDFGPEGGEQGGYLTAKGTPQEILKDKNSLTGLYLSGAKQIPLPLKRRSLDQPKLKIENAELYNLKKINVEIPIGCLTCLTGVSGSGKSTLMHEVIYPAVKQGLNRKDRIELKGIGNISGIEHFEKMYLIDQNPVGHTIRSDVSTYVDVLTPIRQFFAQLPDAKLRGLTPEHFSSNRAKGRCTSCYGIGYRRVEMQFLPPIKIPCKECKGYSLNPLSLEIRYKGKHLGQHLDQTVLEAIVTFTDHPRIVKILKTLNEVGLGYLKLNQELPTLSGGEAQRLKLSRELSKRSSGKTLYLLDEPTTGLHSEDIAKLLHVIKTLVDKGNTMVIIEHNLDLIKQADYILDLGPGPGALGGKVIASGTPEEVAKCTGSKTGKFLLKQLKTS